MGWVAVVQQLDRDLLAIEMTKSGLSLQENRIRSIPILRRRVALRSRNRISKK
jgi:hypothetical protein